MVDFESKTVFYVFVVGLAILTTLQLTLSFVTDYDLHRDILGGGDEAAEEVEVDLNAIINQRLEAIPICVKSCIFPRIVKLGCAHADYGCLCSNFHKLDESAKKLRTDWSSESFEPRRKKNLTESIDPCRPSNSSLPGVFPPTNSTPATNSSEGFVSCLVGCRNGWNLNALPDQVLDLCDTVRSAVTLPEFLEQKRQLYGRQNFAFSSGVSGVSGVLPQTTITEALSWGQPPMTTTIDGAKTDTVIIGLQDTSLSTFITTTTLLAGVSPYTSYTTDSASYAVTEIIGVTGTATTTTTSTSAGSSVGISSPNPATTSGLSSGAKIGIGVAVALIAIILFIVGFWLLRRRQKKNVYSTEPETHDGNLPEPISTITDYGIVPPSQFNKFGAVEAGSTEIVNPRKDQGGLKHEMSTHSKVPEADGRPVHEMNENPSTPRAELRATVSSASDPALRRPPPVARKPVSPQPTSSYSFPAPWENNRENDFMPAATLGAPGAPVQNVDDEETIRQLEAEMAQVREESERLRRMQELKSREEELRRTIEEKKRGAK